MACVPSASSIAADLVISAGQQVGLIWCRFSAAAMRSAGSGWRNWCTERLIATRMRRLWSRQCARLPAGLLDHPLAERDDQAVALGQRNEAGRADHAALRVVPAQQRLGAHDLAAGRAPWAGRTSSSWSFATACAQIAQQLDLLRARRPACAARRRRRSSRRCAWRSARPPRRWPSRWTASRRAGRARRRSKRPGSASAARSSTGSASASSSLLRHRGGLGRLPLPGPSSSTNSSPPARASRPLRPITPRSRSATACSIRSPMRRPKESLTCLNWSSPMNSTAHGQRRRCRMVGDRRPAAPRRSGGWQARQRVGARLPRRARWPHRSALAHARLHDRQRQQGDGQRQRRHAGEQRAAWCRPASPSRAARRRLATCAAPSTRVMHRDQARAG